MLDDLGAPVELPRSPRRVVSLVPSLTEAIAATVPGVLVGATDWCTHPADLAVEREATVVAITDSSLSPISRAAAVSLTVHESEAYFFRSLASTMSLAQALFIALAYRLELNMEHKADRANEG